ncbi:MAG: hypothetical protein ACTTI9_02215 [Schaalia odontolytica]
MADDNKNLAGETERTSILPQSVAQSADQTEVLSTHTPQTKTTQMPSASHQEGTSAFAGTPLESVARSSGDEHTGEEAVAALAQVSEPGAKKSSWGQRAAIAGAAAAVLSLGFGIGMITHTAVVGDGYDHYEQGYEEGYEGGYEDGYEDGDSDQGGGSEDEDVASGNGQQRPGSDQQSDSRGTRPGAPSQGGRRPASNSGGQGSRDTSLQGEGTTTS